MCDPSTVMQKSRYDLSAYTAPTPNGIVCSHCRRFTCLSCLTKIVAAIPLKHHDTWCKNVKDYLADASVTTASFVGHCCELRTQRNIAMKENQTSHDTPCHLDPKLYDSTLCDGDLFLPEFGLSLKTSFNSVDIHALAPDRSSLRSGAWHTTLTMEEAMQFKKKNMQPKRFPVDDVECSFHIKCRLPWADGTPEQVSLSENICYFDWRYHVYLINIHMPSVQC